MKQIFAILIFVVSLDNRAALAQAYADTPVTAPIGIEAQPLPPPPRMDTRPTSLMPSQGVPTSPNEETDERSLDQSVGNSLLAPDVTPLKPTPHTDAAIEDRITATVLAPASPAANRTVAPRTAGLPTQVITGGMSYPSTVAPAASRWEGPQERALDQALPGTNLVAPQGAPDVEEDEVRRLNGGSLNQ